MSPTIDVPGAFCKHFNKFKSPAVHEVVPGQPGGYVCHAQFQFRMPHEDGPAESHPTSDAQGLGLEGPHPGRVALVIPVDERNWNLIFRRLRIMFCIKLIKYIVT